jgi:hypothetical protein
MVTVEEMKSKPRRSIVVWTVLRALSTATLLVVLYYVLPMDRAFDTHTLLILILGLAVFTTVLIWRIRSIIHSEYPGLRAIETLVTVVPLYILAFATTYFLTERADSTYFSEPLDRTRALYFSMTVFSTVGFGDITAKADAAQLVVTAQMLLDLILLGFGVRVFLSAVNLGKQHRAPHRPE